jgi:hypothetical protein
MTLMVVRHTSMGINNCLLARVPVWQGFSGRNRLNSHSAARPPQLERLPSDGFIESAPADPADALILNTALPIKH